ncbi:MAG: DNA recombination protein RmuC [Candidatus Izemoplasmatales bacterium]
MELTEILGIISVVLLVLIGAGVIFILIKKGKAETDLSFDSFEKSILKEVDDIKNVMSESLFKSMLTFNTDVNKQLLETNEKSGKNIAEFQVSVNKYLMEFGEKINLKLSTDFQNLNNSLNEKMMGINQKVEERLSQGFKDTNQTFIQIAERVRVIDEAQKKIEGLSTEMISLQNILQNNQARGSFGEYQLNQILYSVYGDNPKLYQTQYTLREEKGNKESVRADAVVFMPKPHGMIAVDSKFPFSSYSRLFDNKDLSKDEEEKLIQSFGSEVKKHITAIASKYIIPNQTAEYAIMFVPSDGILAMVHSKLMNVVEYAVSKKVTIVSPTTLIPLLSGILTIVKDSEQRNNIQIILEQLKNLSKDFRLFGNEWATLSKNISSLTKQSESVSSRVDKITSKFETIEKVDFIEEDTES